jgi:hypothetical protein
MEGLDMGKILEGTRVDQSTRICSPRRYHYILREGLHPRNPNHLAKLTAY